MSQEIDDLVEILTNDNAKLVLQLATAARDRATWTAQFEEAKAAAQQSTSSASSMEAEISKLNADVIDLKKQLQITDEEREYYKNQLDSSGVGGGGGGGSGNELEWAQQVETLRDENDDLRHDADAARREADSLKQKVADLEQKLKEQEQPQKPPPVFQDPEQNGLSNANSSKSDETIKRLEQELENLRSNFQEVKEQRDLFVNREERAIAVASRATSEMQHWAALLKKLCASLKNVRGQWDAEVEREENAVQRIIVGSIESDAAHHIIDALQRVMTGIKRGPSGAPMANTTDPDIYTTSMRPAVVDMLKLLHGVVSDSAVMWAKIVGARHAKQEEEAEKQKAEKQKSGSWFG